MNNELLLFIGMFMIVLSLVNIYFNPLYGLILTIPVFVGIALMFWAVHRHNTIRIAGRFSNEPI